MISSKILADIANLQLGIKSSFPLAQAPSQTIGLLQAEANVLAMEVTAALAAEDALIDPVALDIRMSNDLASGNLADAAAQLQRMAAIVLEDNTLANLQALAQRIQTNLLNVGA